MDDQQQSHSYEQEQSVARRTPAKQKEYKSNAFKGRNIIKQIDLGNCQVLGQRTRSRSHKIKEQAKIHEQQSDNQITKSKFSRKKSDKLAAALKKSVEIHQQRKIEDKNSDSSDLKQGKNGNLAQKITLFDENKMELDQEQKEIGQQLAQNQVENGSLEKIRKIRKPFRKVKRIFWKDLDDQPVYTEQKYAFPFLNDYVQNHSQEYLKTMEAIDKIREGFQNPDKATFINCDVKYFNWQLFSEEVGKFDVLIIDPPWRIKGAQQNDSQFMFSNCRFSLEYSTMSNSQIQQLPLQLISDQGFIFLWILNTQLDSSLEIMQKWGYQLIDQLIWVKLRQDKIYLTHGYYFMHSYEICLIGYKGKNQKKFKKFQADLKVKGQKTYLEKMDQEKPSQDGEMLKEVESLYDKKVRPRANINGNAVFGSINLKSQKPQDVYCLIDTMFKGHRKIQIFARNHNRRFGIFSIGNELGESYQKWLQTSQCDKCSKIIKTGTKRFKSKIKANYDLCQDCLLSEDKDQYFEIRNEVDQDIRHQYISCNHCKTDPIWGNRFYCATCHNFDLCQNCYDKILEIQDLQKRDQIHPLTHKTEVLEVPHFGNDFAIHEFKCYSCYQNPIVGICYTCTSCKNLNLCQKCFFERPRAESLFNNKLHRADHQMEAILQSQYRQDKKYECFSCKKSIQENCWMCQNCHNFFFCDECYNNKEKFKSLYANTHKKYHIYAKIF